MVAIGDNDPGIIAGKAPQAFSIGTPGFTEGTTDNTITVRGVGIYPSTLITIVKSNTRVPSPILVATGTASFVAEYLSTGIQASIDVVFDCPTGVYAGGEWGLIVSNRGHASIVPGTFTVTDV